MSLDKLLKHVLKQMVGSPYHSRGVAYFQDGKVKRLIDDSGVTAQVTGTRKYEVTLREEEGELAYECSCPVGRDGVFCKHCIATALAHLDRGPIGESCVRSPFDDIRDYLLALEPAALAELILEACRRDDRLYEKLLLRAADCGDVHAAVRFWKDGLRRVTDIRDYVRYQDMPDFVQGIDDRIDILDEWLEAGRSAVVVEMAEFAVERVEGTIESCDDSGGEMGLLLSRLSDLHLWACLAARPDPAALAERLFQLEVNDKWGTFFDIPERYSEVLGESGLAVYQGLAEAAWAKIDPLTRESARSEPTRFNLTRMMEFLARRSGDVEALVAVKSRNLSSGWHYLDIANVYREAGEHDCALEWAERGLAAFPQRIDGRVRDFLVEEYLRRKRRDDALALVWAEYTERPDLTSYRKLHAVAGRLKTWGDWREKALALLRKSIMESGQYSTGPYRRRAPDHSRLVEILLWEKDIEGAWREASAGMENGSLWLRLAELREKTHPSDAVAVYCREAARLVERTNNDAYASAIILVKKIRLLLSERGFSDYVAELRASYKAKRNFMKLLDNVAA